MNKNKIFCTGCQQKSAEEVGIINPTNRFAGRVLSRILVGGKLWHCGNCDLKFRWPALSDEELEFLYEAGSIDAWNTEYYEREDWNTALHWITSKLPSQSKVLDVGCFNGAFLENLGGSYQRFGIEISSSAAKIAAKKGINVVGSSIHSINDEVEFYDCVTVFDVIEHVRNPEEFLVTILEKIKVGGYVIVSTGNSDAWAFRTMGSNYWYCTIAEHISFVNPRWISGFCKKNNASIGDQKFFCHKKGADKFDNQLLDLLKNIVYKISPNLSALLRKIGVGGDFARTEPNLLHHPPNWKSARDHFITIIKKSS